MATALYTWQVEPYWVEHVRLDLPIRYLPTALEGKTLVQLSDIHVGNRFDWRFLIREFKRVRTMAPDIVVYTGDFVSFETDEQFDQLQEVMQHAPVGRVGSAAILGNHDYGHRWKQPAVAERIVQIVEEANIPVLRNSLATYHGLNIVGLDDLWGPYFGPDEVMPHVQPDAANLVLCHNPDAVDLPVWAEYRGWILAGHTHGGQVKPPFLHPPRLPVRNKRYTAGIFNLRDERKLYINRALGCLWPVRFNMRPEVTIFTLTRA